MDHSVLCPDGLLPHVLTYAPFPSVSQNLPNAPSLSKKLTSQIDQIVVTPLSLHVLFVDLKITPLCLQFVLRSPL